MIDLVGIWKPRNLPDDEYRMFWWNVIGAFIDFEGNALWSAAGQGSGSDPEL